MHSRHRLAECPGREVQPAEPITVSKNGLKNSVFGKRQAFVTGHKYMVDEANVE